MIGKTPTEHQMTIFETALESFIDMNHELGLLAQRIDWSEVEAEFSKYYCKDNGRPSVPARKMVGLMYLKNPYNLSDEEVVDRWTENPYMQYFTGDKVFRKRPPIDPADFSKFRKRIGPEGAEILFRISLCVNAVELTEKEMERVLIGIMNHPKRKKEGEKAVRRMRTIAGAMVRDLDRKLNGWQRFMYGDNINLWIRVINQKRSDKDKIYSLHEPEVECISKGKEHKKYKFGNKSAIAKTCRGLIVSALAFKGNPYDGHTLSAHWEQMRRLTGYEPREALTDRGYRGKKEVGGMKVCIPTSGSPGQTYYEKTKERKKFRKRAGIEPVIGHLKSDHRMIRNYLSGTAGDAINTLMAAAAYNLRHWMNKLPKKKLSSFVSLLLNLRNRLENLIIGRGKTYGLPCPVLAAVEN